MGASYSDMPAVPVFSPTAGTYYGDPNAMFGLSKSMILIAEAYLGQLGSAASSLVPPVINPSFPVINAAPSPITATMPNLQQVVWTVPSSPGPFSGTLNTDGLLPGPFQGTAPILHFGSPPDPFTGVLPPAPTVNLNITNP